MVSPNSAVDQQITKVDFLKKIQTEIQFFD